MSTESLQAQPGTETCNDGNACTYGDHCVAGSCTGTSITCTSTTCQTSVCNGTSSCQVTPVSTSGDATILGLTGASVVTAGDSVSVSLAAFSSPGTYDSSYSGTVTFSSSDAYATLPAANATTMSGGSGSASVTFLQVNGSTTLSATGTKQSVCDPAAPTGSRNFNVLAAPDAAVTAPSYVTSTGGTVTGLIASVPQQTGMTYSWGLSGPGTITSATSGNQIQFSLFGLGISVTLSVTVTNAIWKASSSTFIVSTVSCLSNTDCPIPNGTKTCTNHSCVTPLQCGSGFKSCGIRCIPQSQCCTNADCAILNGTNTCASNTCTSPMICNEGYKACSSNCIPSAACCTAADCQPPANATAVCMANTCAFGVCYPGFSICNGSCRRNEFCCSNTDCPAQQNASAPTCINQACSYSCLAGYTACGDACLSSGQPCSPN